MLPRSKQGQIEAGRRTLERPLVRLFRKMGPVVLAVLAVLCFAGCRASGPPAENEGPRSLHLASTSLPEGKFPAELTCDGANTSPELHWNAPPAGTRSLALIVIDRDAPQGAFVHWVLFNLPATILSLPAAQPTTNQLASGALQGRNDFGAIGYGGPCPPGHSRHHYVFMLFAVDRRLNLPAGATRSQVDAALDGHVVAQGRFTATFSH